MGMLNALHHFFVPALSPAMFNVRQHRLHAAPRAADAGARPARGTAIAIGTVARRLRAVGDAAAAAAGGGIPLSPVLDWRDEGLRRMLMMMGPGHDRSGGDAGQPARRAPIWRRAPGVVLVRSNYAFRVMYLPIGLFGVSIAAATLPAVSRQTHRPGLRRRSSDRRRRPVADADAQYPGDGRPDGAGDANRARACTSTASSRRATPLATAAALQLYAIGLVGYSIVRIVSPVFYALGANRIPVIVSVDHRAGERVAELRCCVHVARLSRPAAGDLDGRALQLPRR